MMRTVPIYALAILAAAALLASPVPDPAQSTAKKSAHKSVTARKPAAGHGTAASHPAASHASTGHTTQASTGQGHRPVTHTISRKKSTSASARPAPVTWRTRQAVPTPDRYREIQQALVTKGYLPADQANGQWSDSSADAMRRFQTDQNIPVSGKINSLSLIALGLGPKHDNAEAPKPEAGQPKPEGQGQGEGRQ